jgi:hypothetical protein
LLSSKDESLLIGWDTFFVLNLSLDVINSVRWFDVQGDGLSSKSLHEDLHTSSKSQDQMESGFFLDIVVRESSSIFQLLSGEDKSLLIGWDTFLILDLCFDVVNGVRWLNIKSDGLTSKGLDEDLHSSSKSQDQMESRLFLNVVVREGSSVFELLSSEDESLLIGRDTFFVLDLGLDVLNGV